MTLKEYFLRVDGFNRVKQAENNMHRTLCYIIAKPYLKDQSMTMYEFMPLDGDPTPEEILKIQQENFEKEMIQARKMKDEIMGKFNNINNGGV